MADQKTYKPSALRLIDAAEQLIGERGVDGVSLQQIALAAGQSNKFAVQYHFGSLKGVVDAVFDTRLPRINARRQVLFEVLRDNRVEMTLRALFWLLFRPVLDEVDARGEHAYARFAAEIRRLPDERANWANRRHLARDVHEMLREKTPHLSREDFDMRFSLAIDIFSGALRLLDDRREFALSSDTATVDSDRLMSHVLDMCAAAMECPVAAVDDLP